MAFAPGVHRNPWTRSLLRRPWLTASALRRCIGTASQTTRWDTNVTIVMTLLRPQPSRMDATQTPTHAYKLAVFQGASKSVYKFFQIRRVQRQMVASPCCVKRGYRQQCDQRRLEAHLDDAGEHRVCSLRDLRIDNIVCGCLLGLCVQSALRRSSKHSSAQ
eukprot:scaffold7331_cov403-Prasinococcus_capsulatus_cf.AAC.3